MQLKSDTRIAVEILEEHEQYIEKVKGKLEGLEAEVESKTTLLRELDCDQGSIEEELEALRTTLKEESELGDRLRAKEAEDRANAQRALEAIKTEVEKLKEDQAQLRSRHRAITRGARRGCAPIASCKGHGGARNVVDCEPASNTTTVPSSWTFLCVRQRAKFTVGSPDAGCSFVRRQPDDESLGRGQSVPSSDDHGKSGKRCRSSQNGS